MIDITVSGVAYSVPSGAADTNWAAKQLAFEQALAAALTAAEADVVTLEAAVTALQGNRVKVLSKNVTPVGNGADTTEDVLMSYLLPAATLATNAQGIRVTAWGDGVNTAEATTLRGYFGSGLLMTKVLTASQANVWECVFEVMRTGASAQASNALLTIGGVATSQTLLQAVLSEPLASGVLVGFTGQRATTPTANSVRQLGMIVELLP